MTLEVLYFDGCPSHERLLPVLRELAAEHGVDLEEQRIDGEPPWRAANLSTFRDGKVVEIVHYPDPEEALAAVGRQCASPGPPVRA